VTPVRHAALADNAKEQRPGRSAGTPDAKDKSGHGAIGEIDPASPGLGNYRADGGVGQSFH
jgi:hypothetical protein